MGFVQPTTLNVFEEGVIKKAELISEREMFVELSTPISTEVAEGTFLENITATPAVTIRNSRFERTNTRGILVTTRRKVLIENNVFFRTGMHAILVENDALGWFESGPVYDLTIRKNTFEDCAYNSFPNNYAIKISPQNNAFLPNYWVHRNISIENNLFKIYDYPILSAKSTSGLVFKDNRIVQSNFRSPGQPRAGFDFTASTKVEIKNNHFESYETPKVELYKMKQKDIRSDIPTAIK